jgi:Fanconi anemia group M protein
MKNQLEDIFSKTKPKKESGCPNPNTPIIIDKRESQSLITANLTEQKASIKHELLEIGDYLINDTIIERKTYQDFTASITDKRLFAQIKEIKKYSSSYLILEGFDFTYKSRLHQNAIRGAILSTAKQIPIIYTEDEEDTAKFLIQIARRQEKPTQEFPIRQTKSGLTTEEQKQFILEGFPGIGPIAAQNLLQEFGSLKNIFNATQEQLEKTFDENKLKKFLSLLN